MYCNRLWARRGAKAKNHRSPRYLLSLGLLCGPMGVFMHPGTIAQLREDKLIARLCCGKCQHRNDGRSPVFEVRTAIDDICNREDDIGRYSVKVCWNATTEEQSQMATHCVADLLQYVALKAVV